MTSPAQEAAQQLPGNSVYSGAKAQRWTRRVAVYAGLVVVTAAPVFFVVPLWSAPWGWAVTLVSAAAGVGLWWAWGRLFPSQVISGAAADRNGTVRVLTGKTMVAAFAKMHDTSVRRWRAGGILLACGVLVVPAVLGLVAGFTLL